MAWKRSLQSWLYESSMEPPKANLEALRLQLHDALQQCEGPMCERLHWRIDAACTAQHLWLLRGEIFQLVSREFCQQEAALRINALLPAFSSRLPERMLTRV
ncbi:hypothetical protein PMI15_04105 [Polaromonas sp. CF318]|uniref:hypothetical protein n=1 Tax=Polaromonas sp. CF318 TaxID=1144318 RepID=UPI00027144FC|nr:hypothetical protein [Polaromonas sp. CF318]EJL78815.1 hypothetical protein PMI15_04105 [Polaromonas sp. CF318]